ncbi:MAG: hypothetical protein COZ06_34885 [Armatimonadetes bacterium CG_4_10_14_3_um_filter_66_18]|nr:MAG: hypothetical protein COZ57_21725 [Armatimonadetes bacterium CG_4_8_14_3_um_filter_66_20]PIY36748.1 MAG: hypothetical protein COZ06_34885 [Armatimonadetes bacterium CG_4_10_14_3_um_filter_66_18]PIZ40307.1 MAG: hypothetical protein COY42_21550 [Armatimonadetes bacterium CG_4_10_14_0_8_um_filter_66_14]
MKRRPWIEFATALAVCSAGLWCVRPRAASLNTAPSLQQAIERLFSEEAQRAQRAPLVRAPLCERQSNAAIVGLHALPGYPFLILYRAKGTTSAGRVLVHVWRLNEETGVTTGERLWNWVPAPGPGYAWHPRFAMSGGEIVCLPLAAPKQLDPQACVLRLPDQTGPADIKCFRAEPMAATSDSVLDSVLFSMVPEAATGGTPWLEVRNGEDTVVATMSLSIPLPAAAMELGAVRTKRGVAGILGEPEGPPRVPLGPRPFRRLWRYALPTRSSGEAAADIEIAPILPTGDEGEAAAKTPDEKTTPALRPAVALLSPSVSPEGTLVYCERTAWRDAGAAWSAIYRLWWQAPGLEPLLADVVAEYWSPTASHRWFLDPDAATGHVESLVPRGQPEAAPTPLTPLAVIAHSGRIGAWALGQWRRTVRRHPDPPGAGP